MKKTSNDRNAGRKPKGYKTVLRRVPEPLLKKFEEWRVKEEAKLQA